MSELSFGERDRCGLYTLLENDIVQFVIARDKRDGMMRATQIALLDQSFLKSKEQRQMVGDTLLPPIPRTSVCTASGRRHQVR